MSAPKHNGQEGIVVFVPTPNDSNDSLQRIIQFYNAFWHVKRNLAKDVLLVVGTEIPTFTEFTQQFGCSIQQALKIVVRHSDSESAVILNPRKKRRLSNGE